MDSLVGELKNNSGNISIQGEVFYSKQYPYLFSGTIRENIIFNKPYDLNIYQNVIEACCLDKDFDNFVNRDQEMVGDNGFNLSEGQKARICLARGIYSNSII